MIPLEYKVALDILITILLALPTGILYTYATPFQRGFYCDDHSIRYPYKSDTITSEILLVATGLVPIITIIIIEVILFLPYQSYKAGTATKYRYVAQLLSSNFQVSDLVAALYKYVGGFIVGTFINQTLTNSSKYLIGRLRPHFLNVCAIDYMLYCPQGVDTFMYIENITCIGDGSVDNSTLMNARLSFPSGHSSSSFYAFIFLIVYLQVKMNWLNMFRTLLQTCCFACALLISLSRISDYKHHPGDVMGGGLIGTVVALFTAFYLCELAEVYRRTCVIANHGIMQTLLPQKQTDYTVMETTKLGSHHTKVYIEE